MSFDGRVIVGAVDTTHGESTTKNQVLDTAGWEGTSGGSAHKWLLTSTMAI